MAFDLSRYAISIALMVFIIVSGTLAFTDIGNGFGNNIGVGFGVDTNNSLETMKVMENTIQKDGASSTTSSFFISTNTLITTWQLTKAAGKDFGTILDTFTISLGAGQIIITLKLILVAIIALLMAWVVLAMLSRASTRI